MDGNLLFENLEISNEIKKAIAEMGIKEATPIQSQSIYPAMNGYDILAQAPTGTGKTFAFGIPLLNSIDKTSDEVQGIVVCPTRELAIQIASEFQGLLKYESGIRVLAVYGGENIERQITFLKKRPQVIVATPGRLNDHIKRKKISLEKVTMAVLDEADEMLSMGFLPDIDKILGKVPYDAQKLMFSATIPKDVMNIAKKFQKQDALKLKVSSPKKETSPQIQQYYLEVKRPLKTEVLRAIIDINKYSLCLIFCNTKKMTDELYEELSFCGYKVAALHGDMKQQDRDRVMYKFRSGKVNLLIATDVAARGVDVDGIDAVFNYDVPLNEEHYVHRIGRTGRADKSGIAYTFLSNSEMHRLKDIMNYTKTNILPMKRPTADEANIARADGIFSEIEAVMNNEDLSMYEKLIKEKTDADILKFAAALLRMKMNIKKPEKEKIETREKSDKKAEVRKSTKSVRLFFNVGSLDKVRKRHLEELINDHPGLCGIKVSDVDIFDKFSFMNVSEKDAKDICEALSGMKFKGRELYVEIAEEKKTQKKEAYKREKKRNKY